MTVTSLIAFVRKMLSGFEPFCTATRIPLSSDREYIFEAAFTTTTCRLLRYVPAHR